MHSGDGIECQRLIYYGRVQGVGFRRRTLRLAKGHGIHGRVTNCPDGTVEVIAQAPPRAMASFRDAIAAEMGAGISRVECTPLPFDPTLDEFRIQR